MALNTSTRIRRWEQTSTATRGLAAEFPFLQSEQLLLEATVQRVKLLQDQEEASRAELEEVQRRRRQALQEGGRSNQRLTALLRGHFGPDSERLIAFGIAPERPQRRTSRPDPEAPPRFLRSKHRSPPRGGRKAPLLFRSFRAATRSLAIEPGSLRSQLGSLGAPVRSRRSVSGSRSTGVASLAAGKTVCSVVSASPAAGSEC
jgi:hypothetical protein